MISLTIDDLLIIAIILWVLLILIILFKYMKNRKIEMNVLKKAKKDRIDLEAITRNIEELMENRAIHISTSEVPPINAIEGFNRKANVVYPIIYGGDVSGAVALIEDESNELPSETDIKLVQVAAAFLGKQME